MKCFKIACLHSSSDKAKKSFTELNKLYSFVPPENADVILALGGDGFLLHTIHNYLNLNKPIFGMNCGTVGFLMNDYQAEGLTDRLKMAMQIRLFPLMMQAETRDEKTVKAIAFNEVAVTRHSGQTANIKVFINDVVRLEKFMGDGLILSTAAGSTAYNLSANGPIIPLESKLLALTPVSPFRPRRWRGALLPRDSMVKLENLDHDKRPFAVSADFNEYFDVLSVTIYQAKNKSVVLLFDPGRSLSERIITEQFEV